jgi:hypothetical protein
MRHARAVLEDLVFHVQPPKGCAIVLTERPFSKPSDPNWIATVSPMVSEYARRFTAKVAGLRKTDLRIDWSEITVVDGPRRIALRLDCVVGLCNRASWRRTLSARAQCLRKTAEFPLNQKSSGRIFLRPLSRNTAKGASRIQDVNGTTSHPRSERVTFSSSSSSSSALSEW